MSFPAALREKHVKIYRNNCKNEFIQRIGVKPIIQTEREAGKKKLKIEGRQERKREEVLGNVK